MATKAFVGQGSTFYVSAASPISYTKVLEQSQLITPVKKTGTIDATHLESTGNAKEFIGEGVYDPGDSTISGNFTGETAQELLHTLHDAGTLVAWKHVSAAKVNTNLTLTQTGYGVITSVGEGPFGVGKKVDFSATIKVTGPITRAIA